MARREYWETPLIYTAGGGYMARDMADLSGCDCGKPMSEEKKQEVHRHMEEVAKRIKLTGEKPFVITKEMWEQRLAEVTH